ncbi:hypothetical protein PASE110613_10160 [Paenibacillus sediminis]|uniref:DUF4064 domain-containing protein n=1 Tax=Paenibacillus sediminis TaxID=664909 RepID=A0ABS4H5V6_9BACL|nr:hypothetical protein [Paenibacillus sediminis]MBP1937851.1 hypothetical protein [Paenibacillus sediminis]
MENHFSEMESSPLNVSPAMEQPEKLKFSGLGIASFVLSLVGILGSIVCSVIVGVLVADHISGNSLDMDMGATDGQLMSIGFTAIGFLFFILLNVIGLVLGIIGLAMKNRKKVFAIVGTVLNSLVILGIALLVMISAALQ